MANIPNKSVGSDSNSNVPDGNVSPISGTSDDASTRGSIYVPVASVYVITGHLVNGKRFKPIHTRTPQHYNIWRGSL